MNLMQRVAAIFGVTFLVVGALGFTAAGASMHDMHTTMDAAPRLLGLFPVNAAHNVVHIAFGVWGILAARSQRHAAAYALVSGVVYAALAGVGLHLAIALVLIGCTIYSATMEAEASADAGAPSADGSR
jgi:hypothetical protein